MIGVFDSGLGGLTVLRALVSAFRNCLHLSRRPRQRSLRQPQLGRGNRADAGRRGGACSAPAASSSCSAATPRPRSPPAICSRSGCRRAPGAATTCSASSRRRSRPRRRRRGRSRPAVPAEVQHRPHRRVRHHAHDHVGRLPGGDPQALPQVTVVQQVCSQLAGAIEEERPRRSWSASSRKASAA